MLNPNEVHRKGRSRRYRKMYMLTLVAALIVPLLAACTFGEKPAQEEERVLRIATLTSYGNQFNHIRTEFTDLFDFMNPHLEIEFMSAVDQQVNYMTENQQDPVEEMKKLMEGPNPPDIIILDYASLPRFIEDNLLAPLDPLISEHNLDMSDFAPAIIEGLKALGNDQLYALTPTFSSTALVYNRAIFDKYGVGYPEDGMTWDEMFELAQRVTGGEGDEQTFGFSFQRFYYMDPIRSLSIYVAPLGLSVLDESGERMTVNNESWANAWRKMAEWYKSGVFPKEPDYSNRELTGPFDYDAFLSGKLAMTLMDYMELDQLINANQNAGQIEGYEYIDWDVVTMPVHPEAPEIGGMVQMDQLFAINSRAENREDAWRLIEFIHSEDWAKLRSKSTYRLLTRQSYTQPKYGLDFNVEAFTRLMPPPTTQDIFTDLYRRDPNFYEIEHIGRMKMQQVLEGDKPVEEALAEWENEGNAILQRIRDESGSEEEGAGGAEVIGGARVIERVLR